METSIDNNRNYLQTVNVSVYKAIKQFWRNVSRNYYHGNDNKDVEKTSFLKLMKRLTCCFSAVNAVGGFYRSGIYPLPNEKRMQKSEIAAIAVSENHNKQVGAISVTICSNKYFYTLFRITSSRTSYEQ